MWDSPAAPCWAGKRVWEGDGEGEAPTELPVPSLPCQLMQTKASPLSTHSWHLLIPSRYWAPLRCPVLCGALWTEHRTAEKDLVGRTRHAAGRGHAAGGPLRRTERRLRGLCLPGEGLAGRSQGRPPQRSATCAEARNGGEDRPGPAEWEAEAAGIGKQAQVQGLGGGRTAQ